MFVDSRGIAMGTTVRADLCIIGAGPAGIAIAREFVHQSTRVVLLESGGTTVREENQSLCRGTIVGRSYPSLHLCRRRVLGGSSTHWGGWAHPLDAIDFEEREWVPHSGWPFSKSELAPWHADACAVWKLGNEEHQFQQGGLDNSEPLLKRDQHSFDNLVFRVAATRFGKTYRGELETAPNLDVMLHANVLEIETDRESKAAILVRVATLTGNQFTVEARNFVLAAGGIENPRILLASRKWRACGLGNENDLVGRFFADHIHFELGRVPLNGRPVPGFYRLRSDGAAGTRGGMALTETSRRRNRLLGFAITIHNPDDPHDVAYPNYANLGYASLRALAKPFIEGELPDLVRYHLGLIFQQPIKTLNLSFRKIIKARWRDFAIGCRAEQLPNPSSRVTLDDEKDALGVNKIKLDWRLTEQDLASLREAQHLLQKNWNFPDAGTKPGLGMEPSCEITGASHHMGTTRMHRDPKQGVVDENCRVHGIRNLYIAGASVFPTGGWAPPTLTVVALALRLADFLKQPREQMDSLTTPMAG